jgi:hypothetical protein
MEALTAVDDKAEQIEVRRPGWEPFELVDRVIGLNLAKPEMSAK